MAAEARKLGLQYSEKDTFGMLEEPFLLFRRTRRSYGDVDNVLFGTWHGFEVRVFDYEYMIRENNWRRLSGAVIAIPAAGRHSRSAPRPWSPPREINWPFPGSIRIGDVQPRVRRAVRRPGVRERIDRRQDDGVAARPRAPRASRSPGAGSSGIEFRSSRGRSTPCSRCSSPSSTGSLAPCARFTPRRSRPGRRVR